MRHFYSKTVLAIMFFCLNLFSYAQTPGTFTNVEETTATSGADFMGNTINGRSYIDTDGNFILAKSKEVSGDRINTAIINGYEYENILLDTTGNESVCTDAYLSHDEVIVWGAVNITCCSFDDSLQVYNKDAFPNTLLGEAGPETDIVPELSLYLTPSTSSSFGRIKNVVRYNQYLYIITSGFGSGFNYETNGDFGVESGFVSTDEDLISRLDTTTGIIDQTYDLDPGQTFGRGSLNFVENNNQIFVLVTETTTSASLKILDTNLNLIDSSESFYFSPSNVSNTSVINRPLLLDFNPPITTGDGDSSETSSGDITALIGSIDPDNPKDIVRKIEDSSVVNYNDETTIGSMYFPDHPHAAVITPEHYVFLRFRNNGEGWLSFINKETGSFDYHQSLMLEDESGNLVSGMFAEDFVYDAINNELDFVGTYVGSNRSLGGVTLPNTTGHRGITFSYKLGIPSDAEVEIAIAGYPDAEVTLEGNHFTVSGIPESQWSSLTLEVDFSNSSGFIIAPGLNGSFTKNFADENLDLFLVGISNNASSIGEVYFVRVYTVSMTTTMSINDSTIETYGVYPNPTRGMVYLPAELDDSNVEVFNLQGQLIYRNEKLNNKINISHLSRGVYIMKFRKNNKEYSQKVVLK